jgi:hypothetical protein
VVGVAFYDERGVGVHEEGVEASPSLVVAYFLYNYFFLPKLF